MGDKDRQGDQEVNIVDQDSQVPVGITLDGRLKTSQIVDTPVGTTEVTQEEFDDVSTTSGDDNTYTITNGETLTIQRFSAGSEEQTGGSVVELYEDPNGDLSVLNIIEAIFVNGNSRQADVGQQFEGDGTRRIVMRRRGFTGNAREIFARWIGFEE